VVSLPISRAGSCFWAPDIVFVVGHPQQADFKGTVAHELSHALGHLARDGAHVPPWIDEGVACLVAAEVAHQDYALHYMRCAGGDDPDPFQLPIPLRVLLQPTQTLDNDMAQSMLTGEAAMFLRFLWQGRVANAEPWDMARRAFAGLEPETTLPARSLEQAFGTSLNEIEQAFVAFCQLLLKEYQTRSQTWSHQLVACHPKTN
jgi:hypothetical protein